MKDNYFCDSNIFLYAIGNQDEAKQKISAELIMQKCFISTQVINEVSSVMYRKLKLTNSEINFFVEDCYDRYKIINFNRDIFILATELRQKYNFSYYDSLIVSSALSSSSDILYSEDMQHNQLIEGQLWIVNPFLEENIKGNNYHDRF